MVSLKVGYESVGSSARVFQDFTEFRVRVLLGYLPADAVMVHGDLDSPLAGDFDVVTFHGAVIPIYVS